jgi:putative transposase
VEPRRRSERAIVALVLEAYVNGVSTHRVDRLVEQFDLCRPRPPEGAYPYLGWTPSTSRSATADALSATCRWWPMRCAVHEIGLREMIGLNLGEVEPGSFWVEFLRSLRDLTAFYVLPSEHWTQAPIH